MECEQTIRANILVKGTVQRVGYRHLIQGIARRHHITGQIVNLEGYDVRIIAEGKSDDISRFIPDIQIQEHPVYVESIEITEEPFTGEYPYFDVVRGTPEEELAERFDSAIAIFSRMEKKQDYSIGIQIETLELQKETIGLQRETLGLQKETLGLQKETIGLQKETLGLQKETIGLQRETLGLQKETIELQKETLNEVKGIRLDINKTLTQEIAEVRIDIREMRSALIQAGIMKNVFS